MAYGLKYCLWEHVSIFVLLVVSLEETASLEDERPEPVHPDTRCMTTRGAAV
jgi:hypothetical protein